MYIVRKSILSGKLSGMHINITDEELDRWKKGALVQDVWPHLSSEEREFIISGITPEEWDETFDSGM